MKKIFACVAALFLVVMMSATVFAESAMTRIKDIAKVQGVRSNQLMGYGLVVGLNGTGDSIRHSKPCSPWRICCASTA